MSRTFIEVKGVNGDVTAIDIDRIVFINPVKDHVRLMIDTSMGDNDMSYEQRVLKLDLSEYERLCNLLCVEGGRYGGN